MTDRTIVFAENGRASSRSLTQRSDGSWFTAQREDEVLPYVLDYANWLGADTISAVARTSNGLTASTTSNTTTTATQSLSGQGYIDVKITTTAGRIKIDRIIIRSMDQDDQASDYA